MTTTQTILLVDDEQELLSLYCTKLERAGYTVVKANNGDEAILILQTQHIDLVLMDMKMPVLDGVSTAKKIRTTAGIENTPLVFVTAFSDPKFSDINHDLLEQTKTLGYIKKGLSLNEFLVEVERYMGRGVTV